MKNNIQGKDGKVCKEDNPSVASPTNGTVNVTIPAHTTFFKKVICLKIGVYVVTNTKDDTQNGCKLAGIWLLPM